MSTVVLWAPWPSHGAFFLQMMMQYLYYGGTESMDIPTGDILEVRTWQPLSPSTMPVPSLRHLPGLTHPNLRNTALET